MGAKPQVYVCFSRWDGSGPWWFRVFRKCRLHSLAHCFCLSWTGLGWLLLDATHTALEVGLIDQPPDFLNRLVRHNKMRVLVTEAKKVEGFYYRGLTSCVSVTKMALGIRSARIVTVHQLFSWLLKDGAREVTQWEQQQL